jgi:hypothetical protein
MRLIDFEINSVTQNPITFSNYKKDRTTTICTNGLG